MSSLNIQGLNYDINLNVLGHQYDSAISIATKIAVAAGTVYAGATILGANVASTVATAATADNLIDVADTATDVMSMQSNNKMAKRIESAVNFVGKTTEKVSSIDDYSKWQVNKSVKVRVLLNQWLVLLQIKQWVNPNVRELYIITLMEHYYLILKVK